MFDIKEDNGLVCLSGGEPFSPQHTFECGQCFRWRRSERGGYVGVAGGHAARIWTDGDKTYITCERSEFESFWRRYLDLDRSYTDISAAFASDDFTKQAVEYGRGLRILRQEPWEALCSFIISQCNNIPRIQKIIDTLCGAFGDEIEFEGEKYRTFPSAERIAGLGEHDLDILHAGYRAPYILNAARRTAAGEYTLADSVELDTLLNAERPEDYLRDVDTLFRQYPAVTLTEKQTLRCRNGNSFSIALPEGSYRAYDGQGTFLMLAKVRGGVMETVKSFFDV